MGEGPPQGSYKIGLTPAIQPVRWLPAWGPGPSPVGSNEVGRSLQGEFLQAWQETSPISQVKAHTPARGTQKLLQRLPGSGVHMWLPGMFV